MAESEDKLKSLLMKVESEKVGLKLNIQKTKIMASGPITSWEIDGETVETVSDFILGGSKIIADGDLQPWFIFLSSFICGQFFAEAGQGHIQRERLFRLHQAPDPQLCINQNSCTFIYFLYYLSAELSLKIVGLKPHY